MTFAGTFLEDIIPAAQFAGLVGDALANVLQGLDIDNGKEYCCSKAEAAAFKDCYWAVSHLERSLERKTDISRALQAKALTAVMTIIAPQA
jgi:hypothetical protein